MVAFKVAFISVFIALIYMFPGFLLGKTKEAVADDLSTMSSVLIYVLSPCMIVSSFFSFVIAFVLPVPYAFKASLFILGSVPCASVILNMAEIHGKEQKMSANCILLSTLLCIFTIPAMSILLTFL